MILAEITNFMSVQLLALRPSLNKWSDVIKHFSIIWSWLIPNHMRAYSYYSQSYFIPSILEIQPFLRYMVRL